MAGLVLLRSSQTDSSAGRYSFLAAHPFLTFRSFGSRAEIQSCDHAYIQYGNPWSLLESLMSRFELLEELDLPFPLGGCFGYWGYDLKNFVEPKLSRRAVNDLELPECSVGFYDSLVVFDHRLAKTWIVSTGLDVDGTRSEAKARTQLGYWITKLRRATHLPDIRGSLPADSRRALNKTLPISQPSRKGAGTRRGRGATGTFSLTPPARKVYRGQ